MSASRVLGICAVNLITASEKRLVLCSRSFSIFFFYFLLSTFYFASTIRPLFEVFFHLRFLLPTSYFLFPTSLRRSPATFWQRQLRLLRARPPVSSSSRTPSLAGRDDGDLARSG